MFRVWVILCCWILLTESQLLEEGDRCNLPNGRQGECALISDCPYAQQLLQNQKGRPALCGFVRDTPIVCCTKTKSNSPITNSGPTGTLSIKMCQKYYPKAEDDFHVTVVGGEPSLAKEFPHMTAVGYGNENAKQWLCGGSLISLTYVLTAAHCLHHKELGNARWVRVGDLDLEKTDDDADPQDFSVKRGIRHPMYKPPARYHDIALLELDRPVKRSQFVQPACLNTGSQSTEFGMTVSGWGKTEFTGSSSSLLLKLEMGQVAHDACSNSYRSISKSLLPRGIDDETQICAGGVLGQDTCQGDSGGPLQVRNGSLSSDYKIHTIIGVTSFGKPCGLSTSPGVYTRVSSYTPWIEKIAWSNET